jgi:CDGSH-type Zn-finger protein
MKVNLCRCEESNLNLPFGNRTHTDASAKSPDFIYEIKFAVYSGYDPLTLL